MKVAFGDKLRLKDGTDVKVIGVPYYDKYYTRTEKTGMFRIVAPDEIEFVHSPQLRLPVMEEK